MIRRIKWNPGWRLRARQALSLGLLAAAGLVLGIYWYQRAHATRNPPVPRLRLSIRESAHGFELSRSLGNRTLFRLRAGTAVQMRAGGHAAILRQVALQIFQSNGRRADQIYCQRLQYQPATGQVSTQGLVRMDVGGQLGPPRPFGQPPAAEHGNPIHIEAHNLAFNTKLGIGQMRGGLTFRYLRAQGQAGSADWTSHPVELRLGGQVRLRWQSPGHPAWHVRAARAILDRARATIQLQGGPGQPVLIRQKTLWLRAAQLTLYLRSDYTVRRILAPAGLRGALQQVGNSYSWQARQGTVWLDAPPAPAPMRQSRIGSAGSAPAMLARLRHSAALPRQSLVVTHALLRGAVRLRHRAAGQQGSLLARRLWLQFAAGNQLRQARALGAVQLSETQAGPALKSRSTAVSTPRQPSAWNLRNMTLPLLSAPGHGVHWRLQAPRLVLNFALSPANAAAASASAVRLHLRQLRAHQAHLRWHAQGRPPARAHAHTVRMGFYSGGRPRWLHAHQVILLTRTTVPAPGSKLKNSRVVQWRRDQAGLLHLHFLANGQLGRWRETGHVRLSESFSAAAPSASPAPGAADRQIILADGLSQAAAGDWVRIWADPSSRYTRGQIHLHTPQLRLRTARLKIQPQSRLTLASQPVSLIYLPGSADSFNAPDAFTVESHCSTNARSQAEVRGFLPGPAPINENGILASIKVRKPRLRPGICDIVSPEEKAAVPLSAMPTSRRVYLTAHGMQLHASAGWVLFAGGVRLWQGPDLIAANRIILDRGQATLDAGGEVTSVFQVPAPRAKSTATAHAGKPAVTAARTLLIRAQSLHFAQRQAWARYQGHVLLTQGPNRLTAPVLTVFFSPQPNAGHTPATPSLRLNRVVATGGVHMSSVGRRGQAAKVIYDPVHNLITLSGGSPSIFDAELGFLTGRSLTFSPSGDTIRVESWSHSRLYTSYRVGSHPIEKK